MRWTKRQALWLHRAWMRVLRGNTHGAGRRFQGGSAPAVGAQPGWEWPGAELLSGAAKAFFGAQGVFEAVDFSDCAGEDGDGHHLGDFFSGVELEGGVTEIGEEDEDLAAVAGVDDAAGGGDAARGHGGAVADEQAERRAGVGMAGFDGDAGADPGGVAGRKEQRFEGEEVVAEVFAGVGDDGELGLGMESFYAQHRSMVSNRGLVAGDRIDQRGGGAGCGWNGAYPVISR